MKTNKRNPTYTINFELVKDADGSHRKQYTTIFDEPGLSDLTFEEYVAYRTENHGETVVTLYNSPYAKFDKALIAQMFGTTVEFIDKHLAFADCEEQKLMADAELEIYELDIKLKQNHLEKVKLMDSLTQEHQWLQLISNYYQMQQDVLVNGINADVLKHVVAGGDHKYVSLFGHRFFICDFIEWLGLTYDEDSPVSKVSDEVDDYCRGIMGY